jgi:hypothetical protein
MSLISNLTLTLSSNISLIPSIARERIALTSDEYSIFVSFLKKLQNQTSDIKFGKKIYAGKSSDLSRHKIKEYFDKNGLHKTSRLEQADTVIISKNNINSILEFFTQINSYCSLKPYNVYSILDPKIQLSLVSLIQYNSHTYVNLIKNSSLPLYIALTKDQSLNQNSTLHKLILNVKPEIRHMDLSYSSNSNINDAYKLVKYLINNPKVNVIFDEDLLLLLNNYGIELNQEYLNSLDAMFESVDQENINLALEMLSNINLKKHSLVLAMFLNKHIDKFYKGSGLNINQNRSFKSFIKYFDSKNINFKLGWKKFSTQLLIEYKNDPKSIEIIHGFILQNINQYLKFSSNEKPSNWIEIENCTIKLK